MGDSDEIAAGYASHGQAYLDDLQLDLEPLTEHLAGLIGDSYVTGYHAGDLMLAKAGANPGAPPWMANTVQAAGELVEDTVIDWDEWEPGFAQAAAQLAAAGDGSGLRALLDEAGVTIQGIDETTMDALSNTLADGVANGLSVQQMAREIDVIFDDPARAELIAQTEMARAMTAGTLETYEFNGISSKVWLLSDGACPLCEENEADGEVALSDEFTNGDPPVHPNCVCAVAPVM